LSDHRPPDEVEGDGLVNTERPRKGKTLQEIWGRGGFSFTKGSEVESPIGGRGGTMRRDFHQEPMFIAYLYRLDLLVDKGQFKGEST